MDMNLNCPEIMKPDLCIFLDISPEAGEKRIADNRLDREIYESLSAQRRIRERFMEVFAVLRGSENIKIVDASRTVSDVSADIIKIYNQLKES